MKNYIMDILTKNKIIKLWSLPDYYYNVFNNIRQMIDIDLLKFAYSQILCKLVFIFTNNNIFTNLPLHDILPIISNNYLYKMFYYAKNTEWFTQINEDYMYMIEDADWCNKAWNYYRKTDLPKKQKLVTREIIDWSFEILHVYKHHIIKIKNIQYNIFIHYQPKDWKNNNYRKFHHFNDYLDDEIIIIDEDATTKVVEKHIDIDFNGIYPHLLSSNILVKYLRI